MSRAIHVDEFEWAVHVDDHEPKVVVTLGSDDDDTEPYAWFELDAEAAQEMGGALVRAYGVLMRRSHSLSCAAFDLNGEVEVVTEDTP